VQSAVLLHVKVDGMVVFVGGAEEGVNNFHVRPMTTAMRTVSFSISECRRASVVADEGAELTVDFP